MASVGIAPREFELIEDWAQLPDGWNFGEQTAVATDSADRVFLFNRGEHPMIVVNQEGEFLFEWTSRLPGEAHGIHIDREDNLYLTLWDTHVVVKCNLDGEILMTLGTVGEPSNPELDPDWRLANHADMPVTKAYGPFCIPTETAVAPNGDIYCTDGYGNARIHQFTADGRFVRSWGEPGTAPGQFRLPHGISIHPDGRVFAGDRENCRVQVFSPTGSVVDVWEGLGGPNAVFIDRDEYVYVAQAPRPSDPEAFVSIFTADGELLTRWAGPKGVPAHALWVDSRGSLYVNQNIGSQRLLKYRRFP